MTRFEREINGSLGDFWKKNAEEEVKKAVAQADEKATVDEDGAVRCKSNGRCLMDDFCEKLEYACGGKGSIRGRRHGGQYTDGREDKTVKTLF